MFITTERPSASRIAGRAWTNLLPVMRQMPLLCLGTLVLLAALASRSLWVPGYQDWVAQLSGWHNALILTLVEFLNIILLAPLAVAVHRFVLLGEVRNSLFFFDRISARFAGLIVLFLLIRLPQSILELGISKAVGTVYALGYFAFCCWTLLIFPAVTVEEAGKGRLFEEAVGRSRGNFWLIACSLLLTVFPMALLWSVLQFGYGLTVTSLLQSGVPVLLVSACYVLVNNAFKIALLVIGSIAASLLYSYAAYRQAPAS